MSLETCHDVELDEEGGGGPELLVRLRISGSVEQYSGDGHRNGRFISRLSEKQCVIPNRDLSLL